MKSSAGAAISVALLIAVVSVCEGRVASADAQAPTVVVLRGPTSNQATSEAAVRVEGELTAAGFRVKVLPFASNDTEGSLESAGREFSPVAAFAIFARSSDSDGRSVAEIWVTDRVRQKTVIQRAQLGHGNQNRESEILAVRAVELLKASLVELWAPEGASTGPAALPAPPPPTLSASAATNPGGPASTAPKSATPDAATPLQDPSRRAESAPRAAESAPATDEPPAAGKPRAPFASGLGVGVGGGVMESFGAVQEAWSPTVLVSYGWPRGLGIRATFSGLGPSLTLRAAAGTAQIEQELVTLEAVQAFWPKGAVVPFVCAGAGGLHVRVDGSGVGPYRGNSSDEWSVVTSAGVGAGIPLFPHLSFVAQARGVLALPPTTVQIASADVGHIGGPSLRLDAGVLGVF
jgi:hypothetical protein